MKFLLDTHVWLWAVVGDSRLSRRARRVLTRVTASEHVGVAAISLKEAAWHLARRRIVLADADRSWAAWLRDAAAAPFLQIVPLTVEVAIASEELREFSSRDPADRLIAATARVYDLTLISADTAMHSNREIRTLW